MTNPYKSLKLVQHQQSNDFNFPPWPAKSHSIHSWQLRLWLWPEWQKAGCRIIFHSWRLAPTMQINSFHLVKNIRTSVCLRKAFQKSGFGKWLEPWNFYEFVSSNRTIAAWTISFAEKRAAVSLCRLFLCSRWNLPLRCWQSQMKLKVSWIASFDMLSSSFIFIFHELPMRCELTSWSCAICARNWAKLRFHGTTSHFRT